MSNDNAFNSFRDKHPILLNSALIAVAAIAVTYIALLFLDVFTQHGQQRLVPDVRYMPLQAAIDSLEHAGLKWEISDSTTFDEQIKPGTVIEQDPRPLTYIKAIRTVYIKVNAMHPRMVKLPQLTETSVRNGLAVLQALGFKHVQIDSVASPHKGLILQVAANGRVVAKDATVSVADLIRLTVGDGSIDDLDPTQVIDEATIDAIEQQNYEEELENYNNSLNEEKTQSTKAKDKDKDKTKK